MIGTMLAKKSRGCGVYGRDCGAPRVSAWHIFGLTGMLAVLLGSTLHAHAQHLGQKVPTVSGHLVTVYSISWPTPISSVSADVEICAGPAVPAGSFAFPSFFQVRFADGGAIGSYGSRKQPTLERTPLKPNQCARGWLDFAVTSGQKPIVIRYHEKSADNRIVEWPVK
jgi:hypothetical protein